MVCRPGTAQDYRRAAFSFLAPICPSGPEATCGGWGVPGRKAQSRAVSPTAVRNGWSRTVHSHPWTIPALGSGVQTPWDTPMDVPPRTRSRIRCRPRATATQASALRGAARRPAGGLWIASPGESGVSTPGGAAQARTPGRGECAGRSTARETVSRGTGCSRCSNRSAVSNPDPATDRNAPLACDILSHFHPVSDALLGEHRARPPTSLDTRPEPSLDSWPSNPGKGRQAPAERAGEAPTRWRKSPPPMGIRA